MTAKRNVHGEGNYEASRKYNDATKRFVESGRVEQAAREAAPRTPEEAAQLQRAERAALLRKRETVSPAGGPARPDAGIHEPQREPLHPDEVDANPARGR
jgi:hypothetical protein